MIRFLIPFILMVGCASAPTKSTVSQNLIKGETKEQAKVIEKALTLGTNQLTAGYSTEVTLYTEPLIVAQVTEKGKMNMDSDSKIKSEIKKQVDLLTKGGTCFMFGVHTYDIHRAMFKNWVSKVKDSSENLKEIEFVNVEGVKSVPETYSDSNGRDWHNWSFGCTKGKIDLTKQFTLYLIPQLKNNADQDETTVLTWDIK